MGPEKTLVLSTYHVYGANAYNRPLIDETAPLKAAELTMICGFGRAGKPVPDLPSGSILN